MIRYLFDEHIPSLLANGLWELEPKADIVQTNNDYILVTQDRNTLIGFAYERIKQNISTAGVFIVRQGASYASILEDLQAAFLLSDNHEWQNLVTYVPLSVEP